MHKVMALMLIAGLLTACVDTGPISLEERFERVALYDDEANQPFDELWRWSWPFRLAVVGDQTYRAAVERQVVELGDLTGLPVELNSDRPNLTVTLAGRRELQAGADAMIAQLHGQGWRTGRFDCWINFATIGGRYDAMVFIRNDLGARNTRQCIAQEIAHVIGLTSDLDDRRDSVFVSGGGAEHLTATDLALIAILYDDRLYDRMPRRDVLAILPAIVADYEAGR